MKKQLLFKNTTQYSKRVYDQFTRFHNKKFSLSYDLFTVFILILLIYCLIITIINKVIFVSILFAIVLVSFLFYRILSPMFFYKKEVTKKAITKEKTFKFYFYNNYFKIRDNLDYDTIHYFRLYKVFETNDFFYLYFDKKYSFIVDKAGFTQGTAKEFSKFIKDKMWMKYSMYNKTEK